MPAATGLDQGNLGCCQTISIGSRFSRKMACQAARCQRPSGIVRAHGIGLGSVWFIPHTHGITAQGCLRGRLEEGGRLGA